VKDWLELAVTVPVETTACVVGLNHSNEYVPAAIVTVKVLAVL
jgi:hypothetical protein